MPALEMHRADLVGYKMALPFDMDDADLFAIARFLEACRGARLRIDPDTVEAKKHGWKMERRKTWQVVSRERVGLFGVRIREREVELELPVADWWVVRARLVPTVA